MDSDKPKSRLFGGGAKRVTKNEVLKATDGVQEAAAAEKAASENEAKSIVREMIVEKTLVRGDRTLGPRKIVQLLPLLGDPSPSGEQDRNPVEDGAEAEDVQPRIDKDASSILSNESLPPPPAPPPSSMDIPRRRDRGRERERELPQVGDSTVMVRKSENEVQTVARSRSAYKHAPLPNSPPPTYHQQQPIAYSHQQEHRPLNRARQGSRIDVNVGTIVEIDGQAYRILHEIGKGGTSAVYCALREGHHEKDALVAIKHVTGTEHVEALCEEIKLLEKLKSNPYVIQLFGYTLTESSGVLAMELGSSDLSKCVHEMTTNPSTGKRELKMSRNTIRHYFEGMVEAVKAIHECRIVHGDLKPANFVLVRGKIKLIDFGIAKAINEGTINITRDNQTGTINYIPPEALVAQDNDKYKLSQKADVWSLGCILYYFAYGHPPFNDVVPLPRRILAIMDRNHAISYPPLSPPDPALLDALQSCLQRDVSKRISIPDLLRHPFLVHETMPQMSQPAAVCGAPTETMLLLHTLQELAARSQDLYHVLGENQRARPTDFAKALVTGITNGVRISEAIDQALVLTAKNAGTKKPGLRVRQEPVEVNNENAFVLTRSTRQ